MKHMPLANYSIADIAEASKLPQPGYVIYIYLYVYIMNNMVSFAG